jgi:hypothetical protein
MMATPQIVPIIETRDLSKTYGRFVALHQLNIRRRDGAGASVY